MSEEERPILVPASSFYHDDEAYTVEFELPGVDKEHIELEVGGNSICLTGSRDDAEFHGCYALAHAVDEGKTVAKYENGLLRLTIPLKEPVECKKIEIQ